MAATPDYSAAKKKLKELETFNKKGRTDAVKWCRLGSTKADALIKKINDDTAKVEQLSVKLEKAYPIWLPVAEILAELQDDLKKAKKKKAAAEINEIKKKISISERDYKTHSDAIQKIYGELVPLENSIKDLCLEIKKI